MSEEKERLPDTYYQDIHENESPGVDPGDLHLLTQMFGTVRGELNKVDEHRAGLSSGEPVSKIQPQHIQNVIRTPGENQSKPAVQKQSNPVPQSKPVEKKSVEVESKVQNNTPSPVNVNIDSAAIENLTKRLTALEKQFNRIYKPVSLDTNYCIESKKLTGECKTFEDLFDFIKRCVKLDSDTITITKKTS